LEDFGLVIGEDRALELHFDSLHLQGIAEAWWADLFDLKWRETGDDGPDRELIASARIVRVNLDDPEWFDSLDAESGDLELVGSAFLDRDAVTELYEDSLFANSLLVLDHVEVRPAHRGHRASHSLVRGLTAIFRHDIVALTPDTLALDDTGHIAPDPVKAAGLTRHWERMGFVNIPGTAVWLLTGAATSQG